ncbi:hypothetical protein Rhe02_54940 [Rhizocola hellebori]|uniref:Uncharacterized protein n=1 Tax=Rhizocola hellebori TaxID=1392758 RepID=A0A8J3QCE1_9ACTN|nr:hypothetical protein [Rhizocola hellebori]GIH07427.1 hypothetical protein Rhe02_54940 [Rhizocola hellebori]
MLITVSGSKDFERFGAAMAKAARVDFDRELHRGLMQAGEDIADAVRRQTDHYMPSGYEQLLAARLLTKVEKAAKFKGVTVIVYAKGRSGRRDVERLNDGQLRHPVFGRERVLKAQGRYAKKRANLVNGRYKNPWSVTKIRRGFFTVPVKLEGRKALKRRGEQAIDRLFDGISKSI